MKCPNDQTTLVISERSNIEIDYCPECRGVWLDRGELDKIIERAATAQAPAQPVAPQPSLTQPPEYRSERHSEQRDHYEDNRHYDTRGYKDGHYGKKKKKESFLGDLFDF